MIDKNCEKEDEKVMIKLSRRHRKNTIDIIFVKKVGLISMYVVYA